MCVFWKPKKCRDKVVTKCHNTVFKRWHLVLQTQWKIYACQEESVNYQFDSQPQTFLWGHVILHTGSYHHYTISSFYLHHFWWFEYLALFFFFFFFFSFLLTELQIAALKQTCSLWNSLVNLFHSGIWTTDSSCCGKLHSLYQPPWWVFQMERTANHALIMGIIITNSYSLKILIKT